jgi:putative endonuclease
MYNNLNQYYIYILASQKNVTLYIGVNNDLERRVFEHKNKINPGFTSKYNVDKLVYFEAFGFI